MMFEGIWTPKMLELLQRGWYDGNPTFFQVFCSYICENSAKCMNTVKTLTLMIPKPK